MLKTFSHVKKSLLLGSILVLCIFIVAVSLVMYSNTSHKVGGYADRVKVQFDLSNLKHVLEEYKRMHGYYPDVLEVLVADNMISGVPKDPLNRSYIYISDNNEFQLSYFGMDNLPGGEGVDEDIVVGANF